MKTTQHLVQLYPTTYHYEIIFDKSKITSKIIVESSLKAQKGNNTYVLRSQPFNISERPVYFKTFNLVPPVPVLFSIADIPEGGIQVHPENDTIDLNDILSVAATVINSKTNTPLNDIEVNAYILNSSSIFASAFTDEQGIFYIDLPDGFYTLQINEPDYKEKTIEIENGIIYYAGTDTVLETISLTPLTSELVFETEQYDTLYISLVDDEAYASKRNHLQWNLVKAGHVAASDMWKPFADESALKHFDKFKPGDILTDYDFTVGGKSGFFFEIEPCKTTSQRQFVYCFGYSSGVYEYEVDDRSFIDYRRIYQTSNMMQIYFTVDEDTKQFLFKGKNFYYANYSAHGTVYMYHADNFLSHTSLYIGIPRGSNSILYSVLLVITTKHDLTKTPIGRHGEKLVYNMVTTNKPIDIIDDACIDIYKDGTYTFVKLCNQISLSPPKWLQK